MRIIILPIFVGTILAGRILPAIKEGALDSGVRYSSAWDISAAMNVSTMKDLSRNNNLGAMFIRAFKPTGNGSFDTNSIQNINNAYAVGLAVEVYMTPQPNSKLSAAVQVQELINGLTNNGIYVRSVWVQVTNVDVWGTDIARNMNFLNQLLTSLVQRGISYNIYTSMQEWKSITNNEIFGNSIGLWYSRSRASSSDSFDDFVPFGGWTVPLVKQQTGFCGYMNYYDGDHGTRDSYRSPSGMLKEIFGDKKVVVGGYIAM